MTQNPPSELDLRIQARFDGESEDQGTPPVDLDVSQAELSKDLENMGFVRDAVRTHLEHAAQQVSEARFEQMWDGVDAAIDREQRLQQAADSSGGKAWKQLGTRLWKNLAVSLGLPAVAVAAGVLLWFFLAPRPGVDGQNSRSSVASNLAKAVPTKGTRERETTPMATPQTGVRSGVGTEAKPLPEGSADARVARAAPTPEALPIPESNEAEVQSVEFSGNSGRILTIEGKKGTTTVIWISDEVEVDSERDL